MSPCRPRLPHNLGFKYLLGMLMEWQQLLVFYQVAKLGSFTQAAKAGARKQSSLRQQVKALEKELDCRLIERIGKRELRLTLAGQKLYAFCESMLTIWNSCKEELNEIKGLQKGTLRCAAPFTTIYHLLPEAVQKYTQQFPEVDLTLLDRPQQNVLAMVKSGEIDFGLALESLVPKDLTALSWLPVETMLITCRDHPLTRVHPVTLEDIAGYPLILPPQGQSYGGRRSLADQLRNRGLHYRLLLESSNVELSGLYVERGLGISYATITQGLKQLETRNLAFISLSRYIPPDYLAVVMRRDKFLSAHKKAFLSILLGDEIFSS
jgi:DNA-binding transcriptional LysR family regulator